MIEETASSVRSDFERLNSRELLNAPTVALLGVSPDADAELRTIGIRSVFDLATSPFFATALEIFHAAAGNSTAFGQYGRVPGEVVDDGVDGVSFSDLSEGPLQKLRALGPAGAQALSGALDVVNVRELALWPPYHTARAILSQAFGGDPGPAADPEMPGDLVPGSRRYPTERVQYDILVLDAPAPRPVLGGGGEALEEAPHRFLGGVRPGPGAAAAGVGRALEDAGQLDLAALALDAAGFTQVAIGAILTYTQSWYTEGLALGQLLHTVALAPGESTRIAMIDWSRRTHAATQEGISESEALTSDLDRTRAISEIVSAVASESQTGFSQSSGWSLGGQLGHAGGGAGSFDFSGGGNGSSGSGGSGDSGGGLPLKLAGGHGESAGIGGGYGSAQSTAWTTGQRNLSANMTQNITDHTHQASTSSRTRWATIVREVSQSESEQLSTRSVTNFNHMHALSIEYFEVVQLHRVLVELSKATPCVFIPMKLLDFTQPGIITRFRNAIANAGLIPRVRALALAEPDRLVLFAPARATNTDWDSEELSKMMGEPVGDRDSPSLLLSLNFYPLKITSIAQMQMQPFDAFVFEYQDGTIEEVTIPSLDIGPQILDLTSMFATAEHTTKFWDVVAIRLRKNQAQAQYSGDVTISLELWPMLLDGFPRPEGVSNATLNFKITVPAEAAEVTVLELTRTVNGRELQKHLADNALYYSQAVWRSLDASTIGQMLSGFTLQGHPALASLDPLPVAIAGNYLVFRHHLPPNDAAAEKEWERWLTAQDIRIGDNQESIVPLPSGGVFAEAVLGRFNSAEKLDITRFWNWQDSPIPITAPDIAALQAGSRAQPEDLVPGQPSPPVLKIEIPNEPDPQGLTAILQAIQNGNMFRDMSGLNSTIGFAQSALSRAFDAAKDAAAQAGENMKTAADIYKSAFGGQRSTTSGGTARQSSPGPARNPSETGALINHGKDMDQRGVPRGAGSSGLNGTGAGSQGGGATGTWEGDATQATLDAGGQDDVSGGGGGGRLGLIPPDLLLGASSGLLLSPLLPFDPLAPSALAQAAAAKMAAVTDVQQKQRRDDYATRFGFRSSEPRILSSSIRDPKLGMLASDLDAVLTVAETIGTKPEYVLAVWISEGKIEHNSLLHAQTTEFQDLGASSSAFDQAKLRAYARSLVFFRAFGTDELGDICPRCGPDGDNVPEGPNGNHNAKFDAQLARMRTAGVGGMSGRTDQEIRDFFTVTGGGLRMTPLSTAIQFGLRDTSLASWLWLQAALYQVYRKDTEQQLFEMYGAGAVDLSNRPWVTYLRWNGGPDAVQKFLSGYADQEEAISKRFGATPDPLPPDQLSRYYGVPQSNAALANSVIIKYLVESVEGWFS